VLLTGALILHFPRARTRQNFRFEQQLLAGAEYIAGLHGAGLTNILFTDAKAFLKFHNPMEVRPYFAWMARELHTDYGFVMGSSSVPSRTFDQITIDIQQVEAAVNMLVGNQSSTDCSGL